MRERAAFLRRSQAMISPRAAHADAPCDLLVAGAAVSTVLQSARSLTEASQRLRLELDNFMASVAMA